MEKKTNIRCSNLVSKGQISESKKAQELSGKQWPRNGRRREPNNHQNSKSDPQRNKPTPSGNKLRNSYDKRPRARGGPPIIIDSASASSGLEIDNEIFEAELNSVFLPGSKKQNLNHLLNFHYAPREKELPFVARTGNNRSYVKKSKYNKEHFLQANCQFVVNSNGKYSAYLTCPDTLVEWTQIEEVIIRSSEEPQCPICLFPPVAGKMTKCGHVYCWPCILHYLALSDKTWRKCPICYEAVHINDLKSAISRPYHNYNINERVTFQLMRRKKGTLQITKVACESNEHELPHLFDQNDFVMHSKLILADVNEIMSIIERENQELRKQLEADGPNGLDCPETVFIQQALDILSTREKEILNLLDINGTNDTETALDNDLSISSLNPEANVFHSKIKQNQGEGSSADGESISSCEVETASSASTNNDNSDYFYFYQATDGQYLYLHSINIRMLQAMYGSLDKAPRSINGKILQKESYSMTEDLRRRLKFLQHLPITCQFDVAEIQLEPAVIANDVMDSFREELNNRKKMRHRRAREERIREKQINEVNDRQMGKILSQIADIDIDIESTAHFPLCGSFDDNPLLGNNPVEQPISPLSTPVVSANPGPSFAKMLTTDPNLELWPSLSPGQNTAATSVVNSNASAPIWITGARKKINVSNNDINYRSGLSLKSVESDTEDNLKVPDFKQSFGSAIVQALEKVNRFTVEDSPEGPKSSSKKKKKKQQQVLFSTGMNFKGN